METRDPNLTTAYIALICSALGWVSGGWIAIPGVIIAHSIHSHDAATMAAVKAALRVGYASILLAIAAVMALVLTSMGLVAQLRWLLADGRGLSSEYVGSQQGIDAGATRFPESWAWTGAIFLVTVIVLLLVLPWIRKCYAGYQSAQILRANDSR